jgi:hypothetical protein
LLVILSEAKNPRILPFAVVLAFAVVLDSPGFKFDAAQEKCHHERRATAKSKDLRCLALAPAFAF